LTAAEWFTWHTDADDQQLADEYATADVLVAASRGEGFGLPIVEAQTAGVAVAARDLPVFRELLPAGASFFDADDDLADAIVSAWRHGPTSPVRDRTSWHEAAGTVDSLITGLIESHR
jgi:glycosyltransferase involved in cell wall biosynthesis